MLGDLILLSLKAVIGFAGRRVIEQTLQEHYSDNFQTAEYLLHHGLIDLIICRLFKSSHLPRTYKHAPFNALVIFQQKMNYDQLRRPRKH
jgi:acetyl-CoA carboxylase carboxyl transferase subunit beta